MPCMRRSAPALTREHDDATRLLDELACQRLARMNFYRDRGVALAG